MPSITTYSPYEKLAFFQSIARHGAHPTALQDISTTLKQNEYIREHAAFDANRLSTDALSKLYDDYAQIENGGSSPRINGQIDAGERSPKRRKLSPAPQSQGTSSQDDKLIQGLVDRLYEKYKVEIVLEIRKDEEAYVKLQGDIDRLEQQIIADAKVVPQSPVLPSNAARSQNQSSQSNDQSSSRPVAKSVSQDARTENTAQVSPATATGNQPKSTSVESKSPLPHGSDNIVLRPGSTNSQSGPPQPPAVPPNQQQPSSVHQQQQQSSPSQRPNYAPVQPQSGFPQPLTPQGPSTPHMALPQQRPPPRSQQNNNQGRGSPMPYQGQHSYAPYPQYPPPPPQWHSHIPAQQYPQHAAYGPPQYYPPPQTGRHPQTPQQVPYMPYPHTAPIQYMQPQQPWRGQQWPAHPASAASTPISRPDSRAFMTESQTSTPWKRKQQAGQSRPRSPSRPEVEGIPISDREASSTAHKPMQKLRDDSPRKLEEEQTPTQRQPRRRGRPPSVAPSALGQSRSQSIASRASDAQNERQNNLRQNNKTKVEPPSTPLPVLSSDTEQTQRSTGQRGRPRSSTVTSQADGAKATVVKRKRDSTSPNSSVRSPHPVFTTPPSRRVAQPQDPSLVVVSRNFSKTSQLLLNEITSHKLAGIFAKPLSERDAPGYKDLVLRPQDLKSIKAAISKGGRAALAAIESIEGDGEPTPTKAQTGGNIGPIGNGFYLVPKNVDLLPPKGIVNSAQLETELVRMFANAVMFNPLPSSERGFGRNLRLRKQGGDLGANVDVDEASTPEESENGSPPGFEEGGIIADAREMFKDVVGVVGKWRELEGERMGAGADISASRTGSFATPALPANDGGRQNSVSASSNVGEEENAAGESESVSTPVPSQAASRKRRRIAEH